jgi:serine/threonine protein kinase
MNILEIRIAGRFQLLSRLASSSFCEIYEGVNVHSNLPVAIKLEDLKCKYPQLLYEAKILQNLQGGLSIPSLYWCGPEGDFNVLIMDLLGPSLGDMLQKCGGKFSLKTVLMLAEMLISNIEYIHSKGYLHRDIKPENFLFGRGKNSSKLFTIDFGLSKKFKDPKTQEHIQYRDKKPLIGTARYVSLNSHKGFKFKIIFFCF